MGKRSAYYRTFSSYLKEKFGQKVFRVSLDAGFTCPNRDGTLGYGGCIYCSPEGSWDRNLSRLIYALGIRYVGTKAAEVLMDTTIGCCVGEEVNFSNLSIEHSPIFFQVS